MRADDHECAMYTPQRFCTVQEEEREEEDDVQSGGKFCAVSVKTGDCAFCLSSE